MAKNRLVNTKFWTDNYVLDYLNPVDKLLFLYLITNQYTNICGIYELSLRMMSIETGIDKENIEKVILPRFEKDGKAMYRNGWVAIKNFQKHQTLNPSVRKGIDEGMKNAPELLKKWIENDREGTERLALSHTNTNTNTNTNPNPNTKIAESNSAGKEVGEVIHLFQTVNPSYKKWYGNTTQRGAVTRLLEQYTVAQLAEVIAILPKTNGEKYAPTITTPLQLEDKMASLMAFIQREKKQKISIVVL